MYIIKSYSQTNMAASSSRFAFEGSVESFIEEQENQNTVESRHAVVFSTNIRRREIAIILPHELNGYMSEFVLKTQNLITYEI